MKISENLDAYFWTDPSANNCNTYLIHGPKNILIDPGHGHLFQYIREHLANRSLSVEDIDLVITTHGHPDHLEGVKHFVDTTTLIALGETEWHFIRGAASHFLDAFGRSDFEPDLFLREGTLNIGEQTFEVIDTPGHSPGSICLYWPDENVLFTGDVIFNQGIGRTDLPGGNGEQLKESIKKLTRFKVEILLPGHGTPLSGSEAVQENFKHIEKVWFGYL